MLPDIWVTRATQRGDRIFNPKAPEHVLAMHLKLMANFGECTYRERSQGKRCFMEYDSLVGFGDTPEDAIIAAYLEYLG